MPENREVRTSVPPPAILPTSVPSPSVVRSPQPPKGMPKYRNYYTGFICDYISDSKKLYIIVLFHIFCLLNSAAGHNDDIAATGEHRQENGAESEFEYEVDESKDGLTGGSDEVDRPDDGDSGEEGKYLWLKSIMSTLWQ